MLTMKEPTSILNVDVESDNVPIIFINDDYGALRALPEMNWRG